MSNEEHAEETTNSNPANVSPEGEDTATVDTDEDPGWPWSFILLVVAGAIYLIFRFAEIAIKLLN
jgi:hypothetical protein